MNVQSSIASGCKFPQTKADQSPRFDRKKGFRRKPRPGRPANKAKRQYWVSK